MDEPNFTGIVLLFLLLAIYLLPALIAPLRHHKNWLAIQALNVLAGWTFVGWVVALVWSLTDNVEEHTGQKAVTRTCPVCDAPAGKRAIRCAECGEPLTATA